MPGIKLRSVKYKARPLATVLSLQSLSLKLRQVALRGTSKVPRQSYLTSLALNSRTTKTFKTTQISFAFLEVGHTQLSSGITFETETWQKVARNLGRPV